MGANSPNLDRKVAVASRKAKKPKRFLETNDAISLATSIGEDVEKKSTARSEKHQQYQADQRRPDKKTVSNSKAKLKEVKAALRATRTEAKREKSKSRKDRFKGPSKASERRHTEHVPSLSERKIERKTVSFA